MADEAEDTTVALGADTGPWEAGLERARAAVDGWANRVTERFSSASAAIKSKTEAITGAIGNIRAKTAESGDLAGSIGSVLGGMAGTAIGGPLGTAIGAGIGAQIAPALASAIDFDAIVARFEEVSPLFGQQVDQWSMQWEEFREAAQRTWDGIKEIINRTPFSELLKGDFDTVVSRFQGMASEIGQKLEDLFAQALDQIRTAIDSAVERFKEPIGALLDFLQQIAVQLGLVDDGTAKWGDSIRGLEDVGKKALMAIATGVGYVTDALRIAGGAVMVTYVSPFLKGLSLILEHIQVVATAAGDVAESLGMDRGFFDKAAQQAGDVSQRLGKTSEEMFQKGMESVVKGLQFGGAEEARKKLEELLQRGRQLNEEFQGPMMPADLPAVEEPPIEAEAESVKQKGISASIQGSRDEQRQRFAAENATSSPAGRTARASEEMARTLKEVAANTKKANDLAERSDEEPAEVIDG